MRRSTFSTVMDTMTSSGFGASMTPLVVVLVP